MSQPAVYLINGVEFGPSPLAGMLDSFKRLEAQYRAEIAKALGIPEQAFKPRRLMSGLDFLDVPVRPSGHNYPIVPFGAYRHPFLEGA